MRRVWRGACIATAFGVLLAGAPAWAGMAMVGSVHNFGTVEQGTPVQHQFLLKNTGKVPVRIERTGSSCSCAVSAAEGRTIAPGKTTWVTVALDTATLSGKTTKTVTVHTSDPRVPAVTLALTGTVLTDLLVAPTPVYLGRVWRGEPVRRELLVSAGRPNGPGYAVSAVQTDSLVVRAHLEAGDKPGEQKVVVELDGEAPLGRFTDQVTLHTTSPRQPVITVSVFGLVLG